jgi:hypothetical protein
MKIRALKKFEGIRDNERNVYPKAGDVWEVSEERANFLKSHGVIEFVEEKVEPEYTKDPEAKEIKIQAVKEVQEIKPNKKKKHSKK